MIASPPNLKDAMRGNNADANKTWCARLLEFGAGLQPGDPIYARFPSKQSLTKFVVHSYALRGGRLPSRASLGRIRRPSKVVTDRIHRGWAFDTNLRDRVEGVRNDVPYLFAAFREFVMIVGRAVLERTEGAVRRGTTRQ
jgi:hypothetical protein